jgi:hypothetical protein
LSGPLSSITVRSSSMGIKCCSPWSKRMGVWFWFFPLSAKGWVLVPDSVSFGYAFHSFDDHEPHKNLTRSWLRIASKHAMSDHYMVAHCLWWWHQGAVDAAMGAALCFWTLFNTAVHSANGFEWSSHAYPHFQKWIFGLSNDRGFSRLLSIGKVGIHFSTPLAVTHKLLLSQLQWRTSSGGPIHPNRWLPLRERSLWYWLDMSWRNATPCGAQDCVIPMIHRWALSRLLSHLITLWGRHE